MPSRRLPQPDDTLWQMQIAPSVPGERGWSAACSRGDPLAAAVTVCTRPGSAESAHLSSKRTLAGVPGLRRPGEAAQAPERSDTFPQMRILLAPTEVKVELTCNNCTEHHSAGCLRPAPGHSAWARLRSIGCMPHQQLLRDAHSS